jgi:hypothetical protein
MPLKDLIQNQLTAADTNNIKKVIHTIQSIHCLEKGKPYTQLMPEIHQY